MPRADGVRIPFRGMRRKIAETLVRSKHTAPHVTYVEEIDCTELVALRGALNARRGAGEKLSFLPFIIKATIAALRKYPQMNAMLDDAAGEIIQWQSFHIGLATATENGLLVPVIREADTKSLLELGREIERLAEATRTGKATRDDLVGSTFTIGFAAAAAFILMVASRVMRLPSPSERFPMKRLAGYMSAVVAYGLLLNVALNYDLPLLHHFAGKSAGGAAAAVVAGHYQALRTLALLPYQALVVVTFVIFPLVSRATFAEDREATRLYVTQTLRYALILVALMGIVLAARPAALLGVLYKPEYGEGAAAMPILVAGECCLALLAVVCAILNAAGRTNATLSFVALTVAVGAAAAALMVPRAPVGTPMLEAAAAATALGMMAGFVTAVIYVRSRLGGTPPLSTVARVALGVVAGLAVGRFVPGHGKIVGLAATALAALVYVTVLVATGELGPADRAKLGRMLRR